jgi:predicted enzyme related to lactoylglutathione lyase
MAERTSYPPGTFSWAELATSDADAAKGFYGDIFGWSFEDNPIGDGQVYTMASRDGGTAAALFSSDQPPHWNCYVTVASADESAAKAGELDAQVVQDAFDVLDVGRMAVIIDPQGAGLCLWEPRTSIGATVVNQPGALTWNDLLTNDAEASAAFYGALFGWTIEEIPNAGGYRVIRNGERSNGGIMPSPGPPPAWTPYFGHEDIDALVERVGQLGGRVLSGPVQVPAGRFAAFADPQGAMFSALTGEYDD